MIEIEMSKDIREYEPKIMGPFTTRQIVCLAIGAAYGVPLFKLIDKIPIDFTFKIIITVLALAPVILCGWVKIFNMTAEQFAKHCIVTFMLTPTKRKYKSENIYDFLRVKEDDESAEPKKKKKKVVRKGELKPLK